MYKPLTSEKKAKKFNKNFFINYYYIKRRAKLENN